ncbi:hypothetical protein GCM10025870_24580 [Agromyces marinus]|uniref:CopC domain-containing protein n=1 Tax=Agromyces marinus TaxID=1389020 RepID=A0ABM8H3L2_9MICO|nr:copper resistance CopC family protein [Agromyces marinus]BDZ55385.1 hypothetical protein GCM10025870_24580 [Agromyces marinus]
MPARRLSAFGAVVALTAMAVIAGPASPAAAHNTVIAVGPKDGSTVVTQPETVWLQTNDALLDVEGAGAMDVVGPDGLHYAGGCPAITGAIASVPAELGPAGEYTVVWRVVSADGHPISGEFDFDWEPADGEPLAEGLPNRRASRRVRAQSSPVRRPRARRMPPAPAPRPICCGSAAR